MGEITTAAQAVVVIVYFAVLVTPLSTPPGAEVVSTSTTVELATWEGGVALFEGDTVGLTDTVPVTELVALFDGVPDREPVDVPELVGLEVKVEVGEGVPLLLGVMVGDSDGKLPAEGVPVPVPDEEGVKEGDTDGEGLGLGSTTPCRYTPAA